MVLRLAERLGVPLRERNPLLQAAGFAPRYRSTPLEAPEMQAAKRSIDVVLPRHMPNPCLAFDRGYNVIAANAAASAPMQGADADLLVPPVNVIRLSLHPRGMAPRIANFAQWRHHLLERLEQQCEATGDPWLQALLAEAREYPAPEPAGTGLEPVDESGVLLPLRLRTEHGVLSFISIVTVFGTPHDITLQELAIETFFPADGLTAQVLAQRHG
jgi:hypothetical protein